MKKTLFSVLAGLTVIGSALAEAPSIDDRRALCEKHPDKYVWVEKTEACVPINPCESENMEIKDAYCKTLVYKDPDNLLFKAYVKRILHTDISSEVRFDGGKYIGYKLTDGGYIVFSYKYTTVFDQVVYDSGGVVNKQMSGPIRGTFDVVCRALTGTVEKILSDTFYCVMDKEDCPVLTDLTAELTGKTCDGFYNDYICLVDCE